MRHSVEKCYNLFSIIFRTETLMTDQTNELSSFDTFSPAWRD